MELRIRRRVDLPDMSTEEMYKKFGGRSISDLQPSEEQITKILRSTGKYTPEDELNCGACGYSPAGRKLLLYSRGRRSCPCVCLMLWPGGVHVQRGSWM